MGTVPTPRTWSDGDKPDWKDYGEEVFDMLEFLLNPPLAYIKANANQSMTNATWITMTMSKVISDMPGTEAMFNSAQPTRLTPKTPGRYKVIYGASWDNVACGCSGRRLASPAKNGSVDNTLAGRLDERPASAVDAHTVQEGLVSYIEFNGTTDYVELWQLTDGGTTNNGNSSDGWQTALYLRWVAKL